MGIFTTKTTTAPEPKPETVDPRLPEGYNDPDSLYFIPEEIREAYTQTERPPSDQVESRVQGFARREVIAEARAKHPQGNPRGDNLPAMREADVAAKFEHDVRGVLTARRREFDAIAEHQLRCDAAAAAEAEAASLAKQLASINYWNTCRGGADHRGPVTTIPQDPRAVPNLIGYYATAAVPLCADCELELRAQQAARAQARLDVEARRRIGELLDGWGEK